MIHVEENWSRIKEEFDFAKAIEAKAAASYYNNLKEKMRESRYMMSFAMHGCKVHADQLQGTMDNPLDVKKMMDGMTKTATTFITMGLNFVIPINLFWDKVFLMMVTSKNFTDDGHLDMKLLRANQLPPWMDMDTLYFFKYDNSGDRSEFITKVHVK